MFVDAAGEKVLHQAGLDALLFGDQGFRLLDGLGLPWTRISGNLMFAPVSAIAEIERVSST